VPRSGGRRATPRSSCSPTSWDLDVEVFAREEGRVG
jgi:hypothetical protein